jgi:hypothetical protein
MQRNVGPLKALFLRHTWDFLHELCRNKLWGEANGRASRSTLIRESRRQGWGIPEPHGKPVLPPKRNRSHSSNIDTSEIFAKAIHPLIKALKPELDAYFDNDYVSR